MEVKREVVRLLFASGRLGVLSIAASGGKRVSVRSRIRVNGDTMA